MTTRLYLITYFTLLFLVLAILILPTFSNPPHVDYWEAFFTFHQVRADPDLSPWPYIVNHDPWRHGTFRPLLYTILYFEHQFFGSSFVWNHLANFLCYCILLILLFILGRRMGARRFELAGFIAVFAVLYSHCDVLSLTFHISILLGVCAITMGFLLYFSYLERRRNFILSMVGFFFLLGMFCYEAFIFWPPAILILNMLLTDKSGKRKIIARSAILLGMVYLIYAGVFILTRFTVHISGDIPSFSAGRVLAGFFFGLFNILYAGMGINLCPFIAFPPIYKGYTEMVGIIPTGMPAWLIPTARAGGIIIFILIIGLAILLYRRRKRSALIAYLFLIYLNLGFFSFLCAARSTTNHLGHILRQFRYQLAPNALLVLSAAVIVSALSRHSRKVRVILFSILFAVFAVNIYCTRIHLENLTGELLPLKQLLTSIRAGIDRGDISPEEPFYIPDGIASSFPHLCWNRLMGRKMWGTYQWVFSPAELDCFTPRREDAGWEIDMEGKVIKK